LKIFEKIKGHDPIVKNLMNAVKSPSRPHALLFAGPSGVGKKLCAFAWAQGLLCESKAGVPCGKCSACLRVEKFQHPDLLFVGLHDAATIKIDQIRDIQNFISLRSFEGRAKVVIIDESQAMTAQGANSLLKTLEEPPEHSFFVLVTSNRSGVLPTIQSRCQRTLFGSLGPDDLRELFPGMAPWVFDLAQGRADSALRFSDESYKKLRAAALKVLRDLPRVRTFEGFMSLEPLVEERESALFAIHCWGSWVKAASSFKLGAKATLIPEEKTVIEDFSKSYTSKQLLDMGQKILRLEQDIQANINKNLAFEKFWLEARP